MTMWMTNVQFAMVLDTYANYREHYIPPDKRFEGAFNDPQTSRRDQDLILEVAAYRNAARILRDCLTEPPISMPSWLYDEWPVKMEEIRSTLVETISHSSAEQQARDLLEECGVEDAQSKSAGDVVALANLIANYALVRKLLTEKDTQCPTPTARSADQNTPPSETPTAVSSATPTPSPPARNTPSTPCSTSPEKDSNSTTSATTSPAAPPMSSPESNEENSKTLVIFAGESITAEKARWLEETGQAHVITASAGARPHEEFRNFPQGPWIKLAAGPGNSWIEQQPGECPACRQPWNLHLRPTWIRRDKNHRCINTPPMNESCCEQCGGGCSRG